MKAADMLQVEVTVHDDTNYCPTLLGERVYGKRLITEYRPFFLFAADDKRQV